MGVKSGLKDVGRVLDIPFDVMNSISKEIDAILEVPSLKFKHLDKLKEDDPNAWERFNKLEQEHAEIFRLARRFEGVPRQVGVHASGILVTPEPVTNLFPTRVKDGVAVTLYTGEQLEALNAIKFDILGLKTITVLKKTLNSIDPNITMDDLYKAVDMNDEESFKLLNEHVTGGVFQLESNLFKGLINDIHPTEFNDIVVMTALGRPGPLSAGMHTLYAKRKNGEVQAVEPLPNTWDFVKDSLGTIVYQEQIMQISKVVAGFSDNHADSYLRKALAKKKKDKMALCRQWLIYGKRNSEAPDGYNPEDHDQVMYDPAGKHGAEILGGIKNGYSKTELEYFWNDMEGYASYLFNKSHAACYSYITILTMYLKKHFPAEFMAALLTMEADEDKKARYVDESDLMGITVKVPDINRSGADFTPYADKKEILYGLTSIKGVSDASVGPIIEHRPYTNLADVLERVPKKQFNKRVGLACIKSGAMDSFDKNRNVLINLFYTLRKDKDERVDEEYFDRIVKMKYERETLGMSLSSKSYMNRIKDGAKVDKEMLLKTISTKQDRRGGTMAFMTLEFEGESISAMMFSSHYAKHKFLTVGETYRFRGKRDGDKILVSSAEQLGEVLTNPLTDFMQQPVMF